MDQMVAMLFRDRRPSPSDRLLDPGCGPGAFIAGVLRWCAREGVEPPQIVGIELDPAHVTSARERFRNDPCVCIRGADFLDCQNQDRYDFIIGNPPYVSILQLSEQERAYYKSSFVTATGRFDLYMLFFEQAIRLLDARGTLVLVTPEKYAYVASAGRLRQKLAGLHVTDFVLLDESAFGSLTTYPAITRVRHSPPGPCRITTRGGAERIVNLPSDGASWRFHLRDGRPSLLTPSGETLREFCDRISCGIATGADRVFVMPSDHVPARLEKFAWPTISGRQLTMAPERIATTSSILVPYDRQGDLLPLAELEELGEYLRTPAIALRLRARSCVARKPWYSFHDSVPMRDLVRPKLICKDICAEASFWIDSKGEIIPGHSAYYLVPRVAALLEPMAHYLNSSLVRSWLRDHSQRAANGFLRNQSTILKQVPIISEVARDWRQLLGEHSLSADGDSLAVHLEPLP
ncbi:MAG: class I SAM-dependent methyltransferase [Ardenticatenales bacterium]|nr:class I SAM-dependent methyltransferase [Ardenticatenales bacterium]